MLQPSPTDPKHVPDIVSGHASSVFDSSRVTILTNQKAEQSIDSEMAPPSRPPRKSKKHYTCNERETEVSDIQSDISRNVLCFSATCLFVNEFPFH